MSAGWPGRGLGPGPGPAAAAAAAHSRGLNPAVDAWLPPQPASVRGGGRATSAGLPLSSLGRGRELFAHPGHAADGSRIGPANGVPAVALPPPAATAADCDSDCQWEEPRMSPARTARSPLASREDSDHHDDSSLGRTATAAASSWDSDGRGHWQVEPVGDSGAHQETLNDFQVATGSLSPSHRDGGHDSATGPGSAASDRRGRALTTGEAAASDSESARAQEGTVMADTETGPGRPDSGPGPPSYDYDSDWD